MFRLNEDCLDEIFEHLKDDKDDLYSCLLVNRRWCGFFVKILWRNVWNYDTLIACLPTESKEILYKSGIISTSNIKPPMFNYAAFCTVLSDIHLRCGIKRFLKHHFSLQSLDNIYTVAREIYKLIMNQSSLKTLESLEIYISQIDFISYPGAKDCLKNLTTIRCRSDIHPEFFYHLSQICHNIRSLSIEFEMEISNGLEDLLFAQKNLKYLNIYVGQYFENLIPLLSKLPNTLIKLNLYDESCCYIPFSFVTKFANLQELILSTTGRFDFYKFQYAIFPQLQVLKFGIKCPSCKSLIKFLENNGRNLKELYLDHEDYDCYYDDIKSLNLAIAELCPNIRKFSSLINDLVTLKYILCNCEHLESLNSRTMRYDDSDPGSLLELIVSYSPKNFFELRLHDYSCNPEELEFFITGWVGRISSKSLYLTFANFLITENMRILIKKYDELGIIKCASNCDKVFDGYITLIMKIDMCSFCDEGS